MTQDGLMTPGQVVADPGKSDITAAICPSFIGLSQELGKSDVLSVGWSVQGRSLERR